MKYSVIIPTMWKAPDQLLPMLSKYNTCELVGEILLIDNCGFDRSLVWIYDKVSVLNDGNNLFVNPSWNLGVREATFDKIILANDDIYIKDVNSVINEIERFLYRGAIVGLDKNCFAQKRKGELGPLCIKQAVGREYGFGVFMALYERSYEPIPDELAVWYGDTLLYNQLDPYVLMGVDVETKMRTTSKTLDLSKRRKSEYQYFKTLQT